MKAVLRLVLFFSALVSTKGLSETYKEPHLPNTVRIVNFWATWCEACKVELKEFEAAAAKNPKLNLVLINLDADSKAGSEYLAKNHKFGTNTLAVYDPSYGLAEKYALEHFPTTFVVDKAGTIVKTEKGYNKHTDAIFTEAGRLVGP